MRDKWCQQWPTSIKCLCAADWCMRATGGNPESSDRRLYCLRTIVAREKFFASFEQQIDSFRPNDPAGRPGGRSNNPICGMHECKCTWRIGRASMQHHYWLAKCQYLQLCLLTNGDSFYWKSINSISKNRCIVRTASRFVRFNYKMLLTRDEISTSMKWMMRPMTQSSVVKRELIRFNSNCVHRCHLSRWWSCHARYDIYE